MNIHSHVSNERGIALMTAIMVTLIIATISVAATMVGSNAKIVNRYDQRLDLLQAAADAGLEEGRAKLNGDPALYPAEGYVTVEDGVPVKDASGTTIPGVYRSIYVGPTGITSGQYGVFGSVVVVTEDTNAGLEVIRRQEVVQESFAEFAYFTNIEGNIWFAGGDQIWGPVHSNDRIRIYSTGATFHGHVKSGEDIYQKYYGTFNAGYTEYASPIEMPETAELTQLHGQATAGNTDFVGDVLGPNGSATTRIEFMAFDLDNDGQVTGSNEGFFRVYQSNDARWVTGDVPADYGTQGLRNSENCGHWEGNDFVDAATHPPFNAPDDWRDALSSATRRCYLGGSDSLWDGVFTPNDGKGQWLLWPGPVSPIVAAARPADAAYLFPMSREFNPSFKGVIYVTGRVAISGTVRGQVMIVATEDILIADDVVYATDPGAGTCADMLGIFAGDDVMIADNTLNAPIRYRDPGTNPYLTYDETTGEFIHGVVLALDLFTVENYNAGSSSAQPCEGKNAGRGCIYLNGGIVQRQRGAVGLTSGRGYVKRYAYDQCAASTPPPYFPTTGHFDRSRYYEIDPAGFDVGALFARLTPPAP